MSSKTRRPLLDVLRAHPEGLTPEALLSEANYELEDVDAFYAELSRVSMSIIEDKPTGDAALGWPESANVILRIKDGR